MTPFDDPPGLSVELDDHVVVIEIQRPPHNFLDVEMLRGLADAFEAMDLEDSCRALVLASVGKSFCAGGGFVTSGEVAPLTEDNAGAVYLEGLRLFRTKKPVVAAVHGAVVGGGLGLALACDFRVTCPEAYFQAIFTRLGIHPGFATTLTLPRLIGNSRAAWMFYTGRRVGGEEAVNIGLADRLRPQGEVKTASIELAKEIAGSAPLAVMSTRATMRRELALRVKDALDHELEEQARLSLTDDFKEGVQATAKKRRPVFKGAEGGNDHGLDTARL